MRLIVATRSSNILISGKIIKEMPGSVASGTHCIYWFNNTMGKNHLKDTFKKILGIWTFILEQQTKDDTQKANTRKWIQDTDQWRV